MPRRIIHCLCLERSLRGHQSVADCQFDHQRFPLGSPITALPRCSTPQRRWNGDRSSPLAWWRRRLSWLGTRVEFWLAVTLTCAMEKLTDIGRPERWRWLGQPERSLSQSRWSCRCRRARKIFGDCLCNALVSSLCYVPCKAFSLHIHRVWQIWQVCLTGTLSLKYTRLFAGSFTTAERKLLTLFILGLKLLLLSPRDSNSRACPV